VNLKLATPVLRPQQSELGIPPLEDFPGPAIPLNNEPFPETSGSTRIEGFHLSPTVEVKTDMMKLPLTKKITSEKVTGTPNIGNEALFGYDLQSMSTLASSNNNRSSKKGGANVKLSEDEEDDIHSVLVKSSKAPHSPERKLSNEDDKEYPPNGKGVKKFSPATQFVMMTD